MKIKIFCTTILFITIFCFQIVAQLGANDPSFNSKDLGVGDPGTNGLINSTIIQNDGKILIGGNFTSYRGVLTNRIARINSDGTIDRLFNSGLGANAAIYKISVQNDGKIIICGDFTKYNGVSINRIARLNADGTLDETFVIGIGANSSVYTTSIQNDGKIIVGGNFTEFNSITRNYIARINSDGSVDNSFVGASVINANVNSSTIQSDGKIIITGNFKTNVSNIPNRNRVARLNSDGTLDATFTPTNGADATVSISTIQNDGKILIGGHFTSYNDAFVFRLVRLNTDGSLDNTFRYTGSTSSPNRNYFVSSIVIQSDGKMMVGGTFLKSDGSIDNSVIRINSDGSVDNTFIPDLGTNGSVSSISLQQDGKILIGGNFTSYNNKGRSYIARLNSDGVLDSTFLKEVVGDFVKKIALQQDGKILIGGGFTSYNGEACNSIARLNSDGSIDHTFNSGDGANSTIQAIAIQADGKILIGGKFTVFNSLARNYITRLNADGSVDTTFKIGLGSNGYVQSIAVQNDGNIILGGCFSSFNGYTKNNIVRLFSDGTIDSSFDFGTGANGCVNSIVLQNDGKIIVCGNFTKYDVLTNKNILRLDSDGFLDITFRPAKEVNGNIQNVAVYSDGKIIVSGLFFNSSLNRQLNGIIKLNTNGSLDNTFNSTLSAEDYINPQTIYSLDLLKDGKIVIGGCFTSCQSRTRNKLAVIDQNGNLDASYDFAVGADDNVNTIAVQCDGKILIGGNFNSFNGLTRSRITRILNSSTIYDTACNNYVWYGTTYSTSGIYTHILKTTSGCDSTVILNLHLKSTGSTKNITTCDTYTWFGNAYTTSGIYQYILTNKVGCDSTITLNLTINKSSTSSQNITSCNSYTWFGNTYTTSGTHTHILINKVGCDSTITLNLTINKSSTSSQNITSCNSYIWFGNTYTTSGIHTHIVPNKAGCDSTITLNLTIKNSSASTQNVTACNNFKWFGTNFKNSGTYLYVLTNKAGCDSTITLNLTINLLDTTVAIDHSIFTPNVSGATYQWLDCSNGNQPINGATAQSYTALNKTHEYAVIITKNGCSDTSSCLKVSTLGLNSLDQFIGISIYPNPTSNELFIVNQESTKNHFEILNAVGQVIYQGEVTDKTKVETNHFAPGVYVVKLENEKGASYQKVVKE